MEICVIGAGYVGLTTATVLADLGHVVCCVDTNIEKIHALKLGEVPIYEPGLTELIKKNEHTLTFSTSTIENIKKPQSSLLRLGRHLYRMVGQIYLIFILSSMKLLK